MESIVTRYYVDRKKWNNECNSLHTKSARLMQAAELHTVISSQHTSFNLDQSRQLL